MIRFRVFAVSSFDFLTANSSQVTAAIQALAVSVNISIISFHYLDVE